MQRISLSKAEAGMILAEAVQIDGVTLCKAGTELTAKVIERLAKRDVRSISVEQGASDEGLTEAEVNARKAEAFSELDKRFRRLSADPFMMEIKAVFKRQIDADMPEPAETTQTENEDAEAKTQQ